jgi:alkanesulfonate monooxygenase SsuD/methylene tetrahydromethanopterin reductase-like flavin-dependent oxidoreductase (luciferase family)
VRLGLLLDASGVPGWAARFEALRHMATIADHQGFDTVVAPQHAGDLEHPLLHPLALLSRLSAEVSLRLATGVIIAPLMQPILLAEEVATLDIISSGRAVLGIGAGHRPAELATFGVRREERGARLEACVTAVRDAWTRGAGVTPVQDPHPPIWVAGTSDPGVERAARVGDAWYVNPGASVAEVGRQLALYAAARRVAGRDLPTRIPIRRDIYLVTGGRDDLISALRRRDEGQAASGFAKELPVGDRRRRHARSAGRADLAEVIGSEVVAGDAGECVDQLREFERRLDHDLLVVLRVGWRDLPTGPLLDNVAAIADLAPALAG